MTSLTALRENLAAIRGEIAAAAHRAGRDPSGIVLVAVTKTVGPEAYASLLDLGIPDVGENRVLEALEKSRGAPAGLRWHLLGHLQTNKVRKAVSLFSTIHSVDSLKVAIALQQEAVRAEKHLEAFVEINSGEAQKSGLDAGELAGFLREAAALDRLRWRGLMTMAPLAEDPEASRPHFRRLRNLLEEGCRILPGLTCLSMGMSRDFRVAVEEGATHLRIGTALFERH